jgi:2-oxoglutarate ferredoxin oxidoreductase subunit beta
MSALKTTFKDFQSDQDVRWCPGCGDYSILAAVQRLLPSLDIPKENHVFVSGIGCAARFPYYMSTYGFHTIHGRAPALATGVKLANPELTVWVISGDGDALSIGGNHFMHLMRRNVNINFLLFNNRIYGLTKGQYSPTSEKGKVTKSTPLGSCDTPVDPAGIALAAGATFVGRALAVDPKGLTAVLEEAVAHEGTSFVEIFQNCNVFNDGAFDDFAERKKRSSEQIFLEDGKPALFASEEKGLRLQGLNPEVFDVSDTSEALVYDQSNRNLAKILCTLPRPDFPVPMGVLFKEERPTYENLVHSQLEQPESTTAMKDLQKLLQGGDSWTVE